MFHVVPESQPDALPYLYGAHFGGTVFVSLKQSLHSATSIYPEETRI